jgi:hypothetical protein
MRGLADSESGVIVKSPATYLTAIVTPDCDGDETVIASEVVPDGVFGGTSTFTCIAPETNSGASP